MKIEFKGIEKIYKKTAEIKERYSKKMEVKVFRATIALKAEVLRVIRDYNRGIINRENKGFVFDPLSMKELREREHGPLIDEGFYVANWHAETEKIMNKIVGKVFTNTEYAWWLEYGTKNKDGSSRMEGYHVLAIAWIRAKPKIRRILFGSE